MKWSHMGMGILSAAALVGIAAAQQEGAMQMADIEHLTSPEFERMGLPFSEAVRVGDILYLSGQLGTDPETDELVPGGIKPEAAQTMENIRRVVEKYGSSMDRVVKCTVFLADIAEWPAFNEEYVKFFPGRKPARSAFAASGLALDARVEVGCIAAL